MHARLARYPLLVPLALLLAVAVHLLAATLGQLSPASAFAIADRGGQVGIVEHDGPMLTARGADRSSLYLEAAALTVHPVVADPNHQRVQLRYTLQRLEEGRWLPVETSPYYVAYLDGSSHTFQAWQVATPTDDAQRHSYRIVANLYWLDVAVNYPLGYVELTPAAYGDSACEAAADALCTPVIGGLSMIGDSPL
jgi:hypothetical protein